MEGTWGVRTIRCHRKEKVLESEELLILLGVGNMTSNPIQWAENALSPIAARGHGFRARVSSLLFNPALGFCPNTEHLQGALDESCVPSVEIFLSEGPGTPGEGSPPRHGHQNPAIFTSCQPSLNWGWGVRIGEWRKEIYFPSKTTGVTLTSLFSLLPGHFLTF